MERNSVTCARVTRVHTFRSLALSFQCSPTRSANAPATALPARVGSSATPACASTLHTHTQPQLPRPLVCRACPFLACRRVPESHLRFLSPNVLSRRASVRDGR